MSSSQKADLKYWALALGVIASILTNFVKPSIALGEWTRRFTVLEQAHAEQRTDYETFKKDYQAEQINLSGRLARIETNTENQAKALNAVNESLGKLWGAVRSRNN